MEQLVLAESERRQVDLLVDEILAGENQWDLLSHVDQVVVAAARLPARLREFLVAVRTHEADVAVVSGLPISVDLPPTPTGWELATKTGAGQREELVLLLCGSALGDPFGWAHQQDGRVVHDVCPAPGMEHSLTSASSEAGLSLHTEDVFHPFRGDYVSLLCLRNPDAVATTYVRLDALRLPSDLAGDLSLPHFRFFPDDSHVGSAEAYTTGSVLFGPLERPYLRFDLDFMSPVDGGEAAGRAVQETAHHLAGAVERVVLHPGDAAFLDNYRVVHGREPFVPRYDGADRWLKRLNLTRDVRRLYANSNRRSRILA